MNKNLLVILLVSFVLFACSNDAQQSSARMSVVETLSAVDTQGFEKAWRPKTLIFPADHGAHPKYKNEWWYFTGNVKTEGGREFGYQFTIFRSALLAEKSEGASAWTSNQVYMAHAALTDIKNAKFYHDEKFSRDGVGLAGATVEPFKVWLNNWTITGDEDVCQDCFHIEISAITQDFELILQLENTQTRVLHGEQGLSAKSLTPGNASYYYSYTRLQTKGRILVNRESHIISGDSWFDHEWSTSALEPDQIGWDWFSLQLSDQSELMLFQLRHKFDEDKYTYYGSLVHKDGILETLNEDDFDIQVTDTWTSGKSGINYPAAWTIQFPDMQLNLEPKIPNQELNTSFRYWEGAVSISGTKDNKTINGKGYIELTGY